MRDVLAQICCSILVEQTGISSYLLVSDAARARMDDGLATLFALAYVVSYEPVDQVNMSVVAVADL